MIDEFFSIFFFVIIIIIAHYGHKHYTKKNKELDELLQKTYDQSTGEPIEERHMGRRSTPSDPMDAYMREMQRVEREFERRRIEWEQASIMRREDFKQLIESRSAPKPKPPETDIFSISEQFKDLV